MDDVTLVQCPYCFKQLELYVDPYASGSMVQDCDVCCRPWHVEITRDVDGNPVALVNRAQ
jgi:hypothetical protein